ncbi:MAG: hypothetical protein IKA04_05305 [Alistipes sp.]|nr:hypothetical protein [Alistipes sp.]
MLKKPILLLLVIHNPRIEMNSTAFEGFNPFGMCRIEDMVVINRLTI